MHKRTAEIESAYILEHIYYALENREGYTFTNEQINLLFLMLHNRNSLREAFSSWDETFSQNGTHPNVYKPFVGELVMNIDDSKLTPADLHQLLDRVDRVVDETHRTLKWTTRAFYFQTLLLIVLSAYIWFA